MTTVYTTHATPIGQLAIASGPRGLFLVRIQSEKHPWGPEPDWCEDRSALAPVLEQLDAYFAGQLTHFELDLDLRGTDFQVRIWTALGQVPYGQTVSYLQLAQQVGSPKASRAVGLAMSKNPILLILPCHRVVGSNGKLTGFRHGLDQKRSLLDFEQSQRVLGTPWP